MQAMPSRHGLKERGVSGKQKAHKHKYFWLVTVRWGSLPVGCAAVKDLCAITIFGPKEHKYFLSGYPTRKTGDWGDRTEFMCQSFMCLFCFVVCHSPRNGDAEESCISQRAAKDSPMRAHPKRTQVEFLQFFLRVKRQKKGERGHKVAEHSRLAIGNFFWVAPL